MLLLVAGCSRASAPEAEDEKRAPAAVTCKPAASQDVEQSVEVSGVIAPPPRLDATVTSPVAGRMLIIGFYFGAKSAQWQFKSQIDVLRAREKK
ncbi:MAG TPA: hypothetical protein VIV58_06010 [Kofleriaceae bacterium]